MSEQWYSIVEYARAFSVSDMTVRRRIKNGRLKAVLKDGKYYIPVKGAVADRPIMREDHDEGSDLIDLNASRLARESKAAQPQSGRSFAVPSYGNFGSSAQKEPQAVSQAVPKEELKSQLGDYRHIPEDIKAALLSGKQGVVDTGALLKFCDNVCKQFKDAERFIEEAYKNKVHALESSLRAKDIQIKGLEQQIEDLQLLIKIFENKQTTTRS
ncbi:MAG: hypothetical protein AB7T49_01795 [Oligoflexales bacterium]